MHSSFRSIGIAALFTLLVCSLMLAVPGCSRTKPTREQAIERYTRELREAISTSVAEERRKGQMLLIIDQLEALHLRFNQETLDFIEGYRRLNADYDSARAEFDRLFSDYTAKRNKARTEALDLHFTLAALATADEWDRIGKAETKLYEKVSEARPAEGSMQ